MVKEPIPVHKSLKDFGFHISVYRLIWQGSVVNTFLQERRTLVERQDVFSSSLKSKSFLEVPTNAAKSLQSHYRNRMNHTATVVLTKKVPVCDC